MSTRRVSPPPGSRARHPVKGKARREATRSTQEQDDREPFLEVQIESGRRMRAVIEEHYGEIE
jgi:hypothetical protein